MTKWTQDDERQLADLIKRKEQFEDTVGKALYDAVAKAFTPIQPPPYDKYVEALRKNADNILDALKPFDSGVRDASKKVKTEMPPGYELDAGIDWFCWSFHTTISRNYRTREEAVTAAWHHYNGNK